MSLAKPAINWSHVTGKRHTGEAPPHRCLNRRVPPFSLVTQLRRSKVEIACLSRARSAPPTDDGADRPTSRTACENDPARTASIPTRRLVRHVRRRFPYVMRDIQGLVQTRFVRRSGCPRMLGYFAVALYPNPPVSRRSSSAKSDRLLAIVSSPVGFEHRRLTEPVIPSRTGLLAL